MGSLLARVAGPELLASAWADVLANDGDDGVLGPGVARFAEAEDENLAELAEFLARGEYVPGRLAPVVLPKPDGGQRIPHIPTVRDRVVERAVLAVVTPLVDPWLGPFAHAHRPGLGVTSAVRALAELREEGFGWVARTDVDDCFPSIPVPLLRRRIRAVLPDDDGLMALIEAQLVRRATAAGRRAYVPGPPQGSPLSPLWANLLLGQVDEEIAEAGFPLVRYANDLAVVALDRDGAQEALRVAHEAVGRLGMALGAENTQVMSFAEGFTFLGEDFGPRYPPVMPPPLDEPPRRVLYVAVQGARCRLDAGRVRVESPAEEELLDVPVTSVERLVCFGSVGVSAGLRSWALSHDLEGVFISRRGTYLGHLSQPGARSVARLRAQLAAGDDAPRRLRFARSVVEAKVRKQVVLLQRFGRAESADAVREAVTGMNSLVAMLPEAMSVEEAMGLEGAAARAYFAALGALVPEGLVRGSQSATASGHGQFGVVVRVRRLALRGRVGAEGGRAGPRHRSAARRVGRAAVAGAGPDGGVPAAGRRPGRGRRRTQGVIGTRAWSPGGRRRRGTADQGGA